MVVIVVLVVVVVIIFKLYVNAYSSSSSCCFSTTSNNCKVMLIFCIIFPWHLLNLTFIIKANGYAMEQTVEAILSMQGKPQASMGLG